MPPFFDTVKDSDLSTDETKIPFAMKQYWITEAVANACIALGIDGLEKIDIVEKREERRKDKDGGRNKRKKGEPEKAPDFTIKEEKVEAKVTVRMQYPLFESFLAQLLSDRQKRVPFLEPRKIEMKSLGESVEALKQSIQIVTYLNEGKAREAEGAGEPRVLEPKVEFKIHLVALDWSGVTRKADETPGDDDDDRER